MVSLNEVMNRFFDLAVRSEAEKRRKPIDLDKFDREIFFNTVINYVEWRLKLEGEIYANRSKEGNEETSQLSLTGQQGLGIV